MQTGQTIKAMQEVGLYKYLGIQEVRTGMDQYTQLNRLLSENQ